MKITLKKWLFHPAGLFFALVILIILLDQLIGIASSYLYQGNTALWSWGNYSILGESGLDFPASFNSILNEIWFGETLAFVLIPIILIVFSKYFKVHLLPWLLTGIVTVVGVYASFSAAYSIYNSLKYDPYAPHLVVTEQLHVGAEAALNDNPGGPDPMLYSYFPQFLESQLLFVIPLAIGYGISVARESYKLKISASIRGNK